MSLTQVPSGMLQTTAQYYGFKNRIINGAMMVSQYNGSTATTNTSGSYYFIDRFLTYDGSGGSHFSVGQNLGSVTPPAGFTNYIGVKTTSAVSASAANNFTLNQYIEGFNISDLNFGTASALPITLSFWVQSSLTGTFGGCIQSGNGDAYYIFSYTINNANTWQQVSISMPGSTIGTWLAGTNGRALDVRWDLGLGSNFNGTAGSWTGTAGYTVAGSQKVVGTLNATFYITGVQLEVGSTATSFDYSPYGTELALCQRYCQVISGAGVSNNYQRIGYGPGQSTNQGLAQIALKTTMRIAPSITTTAANTFAVFDGVTITASTSLYVDGSCSQNLATVFWNVASGITATRGYEFIFNNTASGVITLSSEL